MVDQDYAPFRNLLLSREELLSLNRLRPKRVFADIFILWLQLILLWSVGAFVKEWSYLAVISALIGNRYYSLFIIGHDGLHRRIHQSVEINDWINDVLVLGPLGAITRINRQNHMNHHAHFSTAKDPDRYKYQTRKQMGKSTFVFSLTGIPLVLRAVTNVYKGSRVQEEKVGKAYKTRDLLIIVAWQAALISALSYLYGWWGYLIMWLLPVYLFTFAADILRVFCEHSNIENEHCEYSQRLITFLPSKFERIALAPMNMNHHVAHHLWPSIPYYNLPSATKLIYSRAIGINSDVALPAVRRSYFRYLLECFRKCEG